MVMLPLIPHGEPACETASCCAPPAGDDWDFAVTINPEARVTIVRGSRPLGTWHPGVPRDLVVAVRNEGFVTGPLGLWVEPTDAAFELELDSPHLTGELEQRCALRTRVPHIGVEHLTVHARAVSPHGDVGRRDRVDVLVRCEPRAPAV